MTLDIQRTVFSSSILIDKVVEIFTGSFTVTNGSVGSVSLPHIFGIATFSNLRFSIDNNNFYPSSTAIYTTLAGSSSAYLYTVGAVSASAAIVYAANQTGSTQTVYYKMELLWPI